MKYLLLLAVVAGVVVAQDPTGNPMIDVQIGAEAMHQMYEATFDNVRFYSSDILNEQNNELLEVTLETIASWTTTASVVAIDEPTVVTCGCAGCNAAATNCASGTCNQGCATGNCNQASGCASGTCNQATSGCASGNCPQAGNDQPTCGCASGTCNQAVNNDGTVEVTSGGCNLGANDQPIPACGCTSCGCTAGGCNAAAADNDQPSTGCASGNCNQAANGGCNAAAVNDQTTDDTAPISTCGCTACGCSACGCTGGGCNAAAPIAIDGEAEEQEQNEEHEQKENEEIVDETIKEQIEKRLSEFNTPAIGESVRSCVDGVGRLMINRQAAILGAIEDGRVRSTDLQLKAISGLIDFNLLLNFDTYYETMTPVIYEYYNILLNEIDPELERLVGDLEYNREMLTVQLRGCLENIAARHLLN